MLKKIYLKNFKGIGDPGVVIDLKPITLLFGPNSGGKSTILHSILYAKEIFERRNYNPVSSYYGGLNSDLGGFYNFVNNHDLSKAIWLGFELNLEREEYSDETEFVSAFLSHGDSSFIEDDYDKKYYKNYVAPIESILNDAQKALMTIKIEWIKVLNAPIGIGLNLSINDEPFLEISFSRISDPFVYYKLKSINYSHPLLLNVFSQLDLNSFLSVITAFQKKNDLELPTFSQPFPLNDNFLFAQVFNEFLISHQELGKECHRFLIVIGKVLRSIHLNLIEDLNKFRYIGPIRKIPERNFIPHLSDEKNRWADGSAAWDSLFNSSVLPLTVNKWMTLLKLNYLIKIREDKDLTFDISQNINDFLNKQENKLEEQLQDYYDLISDTTEIAQKAFLDFYKNIPFSELKNELNSLIEKLPGSAKIFLVDQNTNIHLQPFDIGVGLSQVIPVIIGILEKSYSIFSVEQPELHIHPAVQVELADLFIDQVNRDSDSIYLIETHSEHLILRMLRRIESSTKKILSITAKDIRNNKKERDALFKSSSDTFTYLDPNMINVFWCQQNKEGQTIDNMPIDETGEFTRQWPDGFFEERSKELFPDD
jgi:predicted ATP-dependent endonuclease of OLD family